MLVLSRRTVDRPAASRRASIVFERKTGGAMGELCETQLMENPSYQLLGYFGDDQ
jgi:hypothetical protein